MWSVPRWRATALACVGFVVAVLVKADREGLHRPACSAPASARRRSRNRCRRRGTRRAARRRSCRAAPRRAAARRAVDRLVVVRRADRAGPPSVDDARAVPVAGRAPARLPARSVRIVPGGSFATPRDRSCAAPGRSRDADSRDGVAVERRRPARVRAERLQLGARTATAPVVAA